MKLNLCSFSLSSFILCVPLSRPLPLFSASHHFIWKLASFDVTKYTILSNYSPKLVWECEAVTELHIFPAINGTDSINQKYSRNSSRNTLTLNIDYYLTRALEPEMCTYSSSVPKSNAIRTSVHCAIPRFRVTFHNLAHFEIVNAQR